MPRVKQNKKPDILQALAIILETEPDAKVTTSLLAKKVGVSEAALYRHFPSKTKMFEGLVEFLEESIFSRISKIILDESNGVVRCQKILWLFLSFSEKNPGFTRLMIGDVFSGEHGRLRIRMRQFFQRFESQLKIIIRDHAIAENWHSNVNIAYDANLLMAVVEGRIVQFFRSDFKLKPTVGWIEQWSLLRTSIFDIRSNHEARRLIVNSLAQESSCLTVGT